LQLGNCFAHTHTHTHTESTSDVIRIINIDGRTHIIYTAARTEALFGIIRHIIIYKYYIILYMMDYFDRSCGIQQHVYAYIWYRYDKHDECVMRKENWLKWPPSVTMIIFYIIIRYYIIITCSACNDCTAGLAEVFGP